MHLMLYAERLNINIVLNTADYLFAKLFADADFRFLATINNH